MKIKRKKKTGQIIQKKPELKDNKENNLES